ncbi:MAG: DNA polymerase III subunit chi, partial [Rugosibacter sp.]
MAFRQRKRFHRSAGAFTYPVFAWACKSGTQGYRQIQSCDQTQTDSQTQEKMTRISFFHGANDRLHAAAQWVAEAYRKSTPVLIYTPQEKHAETLDRLLWTQTALGFTPHCRASAALAAETPVLIATQL